MFGNSNNTVRGDCSIDLNLYGILIVAEEFLDVQMLLHPFEEKLYPPAVSIQKRDLFGGHIPIVRIENESVFTFCIAISNPSKVLGILVLCLQAIQTDNLVGHNT